MGIPTVEGIKSDALEPYDYQKDLIRKLGAKLAKSTRGSAFLVSPPGSGKTLMMACTAKKFTDKHLHVLVFVHKIEIVEQIKKTFRRQGIDMRYVYVGMVQTITRHYKEIRKKPFLIMVDEAHHAASPTYVRIIKYFKDAYKLYFTATPWRGDGKGFEELADNNDMVLGPTVKWLIAHKKLAPFKYYSNVLVDKSKLKISKTTGDYTQKSIDQQTNKINVDEMIRMYKEIGENKQGIIYASSIEQSKRITEAFNEAGIKTAHLDGASGDEERAKWLQEYRDGKIKIISNVQIFTEGVDLPNACVALIARPTKSLALYFQFSMRVLRYQPGKLAKIIDFSGVANELGLPDREFEWTLLSRDVKKKDTHPPVVFVCENCDYTFGPDQARQERGVNPDPDDFHDKDEEGTLYFCPQCKKFVEFKYDREGPNWETDEINDNMGYLDEEQQRLNHLRWLDNARVSRSQGLQTNAEIIKHQHPEMRENDIIIDLIKLFVPSWKNDDRPEVVLGSSRSEQDFSDDSIEKMYETIGAESNLEKFKRMYAGRVHLTLKSYLLNIDLTRINSDDDMFPEIFNKKLETIAKESRGYGDRPSRRSIIDAFVKNIISRLPKESASMKRDDLARLYQAVTEHQTLQGENLRLFTESLKDQSAI